MSTLSEPATTTAAERRASGYQPIADYGLLADCTSSALVDRDGSIDWLCMPHYDSPAVFARILDPNAGHWSIAPVGPSTSERRYLPGTLVIETTFTTATGSVRLIDATSKLRGACASSDTDSRTVMAIAQRFMRVLLCAGDVAGVISSRWAG